MDLNKCQTFNPLQIDDKLWGDKKLCRFSQRDQMGEEVEMADTIVHPTQSEVLAWIGNDQVI